MATDLPPVTVNTDAAAKLAAKHGFKIKGFPLKGLWFVDAVSGIAVAPVTEDFLGSLSAAVAVYPEASGQKPDALKTKLLGLGGAVPTIIGIDLASGPDVSVQHTIIVGNGVHDMPTAKTVPPGTPAAIKALPPCDLLDALEYGQRVHGSDKSGDYIYTAGNRPDAHLSSVRLATRFKGSALTLRVELKAAADADISSRLAACGLLTPKKHFHGTISHWSSTFANLNYVQVEMLIAAIRRVALTEHDGSPF